MHLRKPLFNLGSNTPKSLSSAFEPLKGIQAATARQKTVAITLPRRQCIVIVILVLSPVILADNGRPEQNRRLSLALSLSFSVCVCVCVRTRHTGCRAGPEAPAFIIDSELFRDERRPAAPRPTGATVLGLNKYEAA